MLLMNAKEVQNNFGTVMSAVNKESIGINRYGKTTAVIISYEDYKKFQAFEDEHWAIRAGAAAEEEYLSAKESNEVLDQLLRG